MQNYPIGLQDFAKLREGNYLYVDKTEQIYSLLQNGNYYFLSRPRRFGKSLLLSTLKEIFLGNKQYFEGLWIENKIEWKTYPIIHLSFGMADFKELGLRKSILSKLETHAEQYGIGLEKEGVGQKFSELITKLAERGKVVILIDEYDKPIIEYLGKEEMPQALENRAILKEFYSVIKDLDRKIRFLFITGVSKFSKVSIFSDLNHLQDITLQRQFATLLGYTQAELEFYFEAEIQEIAKERQISREKILEQIRFWYNGYSWNGVEKMYNPFSILNFMASQDFMNYWFITGTPTFLVKLLNEKFQADFENVKVTQATFESADLLNLDPKTVLFQTGYLTIKQRQDDFFTLGYPNKEVKDSLLSYLLADYTQHYFAGDVRPLVHDIGNALKTNDLSKFVDYFNALFAHIPYEIFIPNAEKYYHSVIYLTLHLLGYEVQAEISVSTGRIDAVLETEDRIFVVEFKLNRSAKAALDQIKKNNYFQKFVGQGKAISLVGINFSAKKKRIGNWKVEEVEV